ncbi:ABC transporter ATP-binding protein [Streptomonospora litoralis]|uniref:Iron(3+)-hydroxamate import ATP-binding protein FhuC n=1 Tax=Streptomonospora litoralis TaxID=2498135 RepID=A0A4P6Q6Z9_9ACTN|nr:ABC transporter ATP-binding protein [Streptomonospora litoralis]QBI54859.1 Iron(3+)-hydroxamate import ATP-binding protein FhuC [Streptomonospora litoralis]
MRIALDRITVSVAGNELVRALSLDVPDGKIVGLVGPNGSGKTTALRCVYRALKPTRGTVWIDGGTDLHAQTLRQSALQVAALSQEDGTDLDFTAAEVVALGRTPHKRGNEPLTAAERDLCRRAMHALEVDHLAHRGVLTLSGGERQRVLIARALVQQPRVLVLDEPTNHLDMRHQIELLGLLKESGLSVLVILHDLNLAAVTCDRLGLLAEGALVAAGTPAEVLTEERIESVFNVATRVVSHPLSGTPQILYTLPAHRRWEGTPV